MRCPRCGQEVRVADPARDPGCPHCGAALVAPGPSLSAAPGRPPQPGQPPPAQPPQGQPPSAQAPQYQAPQAQSGGAPWQVPPQFSAAPARWVHGAQQPSTQSPAGPHPASPHPTGPHPTRTKAARGLGLVLQVLFGLEALATLVYTVFALADRRAIFSTLADEPGSVTRQAAERSDTINLVLFVAVLVVTAVTLVFLLAWAVRGRGALTAGSLGAGWWIAVIVGAAAVTIALVLHAGSEPARIALGYDILAAGTVALAIASVLGVVAVRRLDPGATGGASL